MRYTGGYHRNTADRTERRIPEGAGKKTNPGRSGKRDGDAERFLFFLGILAVALSLAVPVGRSGGSHPERTADPRAAAAVMSTAVNDGEFRDPAEDRTASAEAEESVFDVIGRFFAGLITGG